MRKFFYQVQCFITINNGAIRHVVPDSEIFQQEGEAKKHIPKFQECLKKVFSTGEEMEFIVATLIME